MKLYGGIDLHSNNIVLTLQNNQDHPVYEKRLPNDLDWILHELEAYSDSIAGLVVESTYNWYWLVDGLMEADYKVHLANPAAIKQYEGLKYTDDKHDSRWLAHLLRLGILKEGYIYPKEERSIRDLFRKRSQLVRQRTTNMLSLQNLITRNTGKNLNGNRIKRLKEEDVDLLFPDVYLALAAKANLKVLHFLTQQIETVEKAVKKSVRLKPAFEPLRTVSGIGDILAMTIMLETGDIRRFPKVGNYASYCRCVKSERRSNEKSKGKGNEKNGNKFLAWAYVESAHFAVRYEAKIKRYYQRKRAKSNGMVAIKAVANKLARACYYLMRDQVTFDLNKAFN
jgi:transposase